MSDTHRSHKRVRFVDVAASEAEPAWLREGSAVLSPDVVKVETLRPPEIAPDAAAHPLSPILESLPPPPPPLEPELAPHAFGGPAFSNRPSQLPPRPSQYPPRPSQLPPRPSQYPPRPSQLPPEPIVERARDTSIEELVPRAEEEAHAAISAAVEGFMAARKALLEGAEAELVALVQSIARRVIAKELETDPSIVIGLVRAGLDALGHADRVSVRLGTFWEQAAPELEHQLAQSGVECQIKLDRTLGQYACLLETELGRVDESIEARLDVLMQHLGGGAP